INDGESSTEVRKPTALITRDLLGGSCTVDSKELDLDLKVPCGWEKLLDLKSGKVYLQRRETSNSGAAGAEAKKSTTNFHDLNFPPPAKQTTPLSLFDDVLDLKLVSASPPLSVHGSSTSVCTLDKVKSALERAERESPLRKRSISSVSKSSSSSSSSVKNVEIGDSDQEEKSGGVPAPFAAGCPRCLLYVLISRGNPICPRCNSYVPAPP
ncbi:hypothetical protein M569_06626, partial [Genlisea aurea]